MERAGERREKRDEDCVERKERRRGLKRSERLREWSVM